MLNCNFRDWKTKPGSMLTIPSRKIMMRWAYGDPAPCIDSTRAVPPVMASIRRPILMPNVNTNHMSYGAIINNRHVR
jgi:hypothetical protein